MRKNKLRVRVSAVLVLITILSGCATTIDAPPVAISDRTNEEPFQLEILDEVFDGKKLFLELRVHEFADRSMVPALVQLKTVANGVSIGESFILLNKTEPEMPFRLSADAEHFTDYQVDIFWGQDAKAYLKSISPAKFISVNNVILTDPDAAGVRRIQGEFLNEGLETITQIPIAVEFQWVADGEYLDLSKLSPENATDIEVTDTSIEPGSSKPFSIEISAPLPVPEVVDGKGGGRWQVVVKVR